MDFTTFKPTESLEETLGLIGLESLETFGLIESTESLESHIASEIPVTYEIPGISRLFEIPGIRESPEICELIETLSKLHNNCHRAIQAQSFAIAEYTLHWSILNYKLQEYQINNSTNNIINNIINDKEFDIIIKSNFEDNNQ